MKKRTRGKMSLDARFTPAVTPMFVLDTRRQIVFFNAGMERLCGITAEDVLGRTCDYTSDANGDAAAALASALAPPPDVAAGIPAIVPKYIPQRSGPALPKRICFFPFMEDSSHLRAVLGVVAELEQPAHAPAPTAAQQLHAELAALRQQLRQRYSLRSFVARSTAMTRVLEQFQLARLSRTGVLIVGEHGVGKEHLARVIHYEGELAQRPFVPLNCRLLPARELKTALRRMLEPDVDDAPATPKIRAGTLLLDEVEALPRDLQEFVVQKYRAPERQQERPRLMGATNTDLEASIDADRFLPELFYLLTPLTIDIPPLRERRDDVRLLAQHFLEILNRGAEHQIGGFSDDVWSLFAEYNWPGNVEELAAVVAESRNACDQVAIHPEHLPFRFRTGLDAQLVGPPVTPRPVELEPLLIRVETEQIRLALEQCKFSKSHAAKLLGITRQRLYRRMQALGIEDVEAE